MQPCMMTVPDTISVQCGSLLLAGCSSAESVSSSALVEGDTAIINKFDYVDFIYSDVKYRKEDIYALQETIRKKYDIMMEKKQKQQNQKRRK